MKNKFLVFGIFCMMAVNLQAQSDSLLQNTDIQRCNFRLAVNYSNGLSFYLGKDQLRTMLSDKQFKAYKHARRCFVASIPLLAIGVPSIIYTGIVYNDERQHNYIFNIAGLFLVMSLPYLISGTTLMIYSANRLNNIAKDYNHHLPYKKFR